MSSATGPVSMSIVTVVPVKTGPLYPVSSGNATTAAPAKYTGSAGVRNGMSYVVGVITVLVGFVLI
jgi:hypothetical protein